MDNIKNNQILSDEKLVEEIAEKRNNRVENFEMNLSLDDIPDVMPAKQEEYEGVITDELDLQPDHPTVILQEFNEQPPITKSKSKATGCITRLIIALLILSTCCGLATVLSTFLLDVTGSTRNSKVSDVVIPEGASTEQVAEILSDKGLIDHILYFRIYSRLTKADGKWQSGAFNLQADMGFPALIEALQVSPPRETVTVMLREGLTVDEMAEILEENAVCSKEEFINAVLYGDYDYDFIQEIPTEEDDKEYAYRVYPLEGYLFPDTYNFYVDSLGKTVVDRMLQNFQSKLTTEIKVKIKNLGWTLDEAVIIASMIQGEGDTRKNMDKVSRVLHNRMSPDSAYPLLQLCSTRDYANELADNDHYAKAVLHAAYNTYDREGLPIGPICNPGFDALLAALSPSEDAEIMQCYFFATDYKTGITYFSKTLQEHQQIIRKYGIEDLG